MRDLATNTEPEWSKNRRVAPDDDFYDAIWLTGYDGQSVWGYDTGMFTFFAQVWDNDSTSETPDLWVTPPSYRPIPRAQMLVPWIVDHIGYDPLPIVRAMGLAQPNPRLKPLDELRDYQRELWQRPPSDYTNGELAAVEWVIGTRPDAPSAGGNYTADHDDPIWAHEVDAESVHASGNYTADHDDPIWAHEVDAESVHASGITYLTPTDRAVGIETGLINALAR